MMVIGVLLHSTYDTAILAHTYAQYLLEPVKAGDIIFIGQCLFIGSETTSVWLMVTEVKGEEKVCLIKNSATLAGSLFSLHVSQIHIQLSTLTEKDKEDSVDYVVLGAFSKLAAICSTYPFQQRPRLDGTPRYRDIADMF